MQEDRVSERSERPKLTKRKRFGLEDLECTETEAELSDELSAALSDDDFYKAYRWQPPTPKDQRNNPWHRHVLECAAKGEFWAAGLNDCDQQNTLTTLEPLDNTSDEDEFDPTDYDGHSAAAGLATAGHESQTCLATAGHESQTCLIDLCTPSPASDEEQSQAQDSFPQTFPETFLDTVHDTVLVNPPKAVQLQELLRTPTPHGRVCTNLNTTAACANQSEHITGAGCDSSTKAAESHKHQKVSI